MLAMAGPSSSHVVQPVGAQGNAPAPRPANSTSSNSASATESIPKSEAYDIGWMFVQQYYTFVNLNPSRLHCFYNKQGTMVRGLEGETVSLSQGQVEISAKFAQLALEDCKVLISNVDILSSLNGQIIVQTMGEYSNKSEKAKRFCQTFILIEQNSNFSILNDIFRQISNSPADSSNVATEAPTKVANPPKQTQVEPIAKPAPTPTPAPQPEVPAPSKPVTPSVPEPKQEIKATETPKSAPAQSSTESKPSVPKSWATLAASSKPAAGAVASSTTSPSSPAKPPVPSSQAEATPPASTDTSKCGVFFRLIKDTPKPAIHEAFSVFGQIKTIEVKSTQVFLDFATPEAAAKAVNQGKIKVLTDFVSVETRHPKNPSRQNSTGQFDRRANTGYNSSPRRGQNDPAPERSGTDKQAQGGPNRRGGAAGRGGSRGGRGGESK